MSYRNAVITHLIIGIIKTYFYVKLSYFPDPYTSIKNKTKTVLDLFNYTTKSDLKSATGIDTSQLGRKSDLAILKSDVDELALIRLGLLRIVSSGGVNLTSPSYLKKN